MKCSFCISDLLEEISSLSHSVVFLHFFALIAEEGFLISSCYSLELCIQMFISFLFSFAFYFSSLRNRFKGLDLIDRVPDELWNEVRDIVQETGIKTIPMEKKCKKKPIIDTLKKERNTSMLLKKTIKQQPEVNCRCKEMEVCHTL